jgi:anti-sigma regulatory factor (Ser/Thr protein kinase)
VLVWTPDDEAADILLEAVGRLGAEAVRVEEAPPPATAARRCLVIVDAARVPAEALATWRTRLPMLPWLAIVRPRTAPDLVRHAAGHLEWPYEPGRPGDVLARWVQACHETPAIGRFLVRLERNEVELGFHPRPGVNAEVIRFLLRDLQARLVGRRVPRTEIQLALHEALANALEHGNLGITFEEKSAALESPGGVRALVDDRLKDDHLAARLTHVRAQYTDTSVTYVVRDEGAGFDAGQRSAAPMAAATALHGRGIKLIQHVMDSVAWNHEGTEITMSRTCRASDDPLGTDEEGDDEADDGTTRDPA